MPSRRALYVAVEGVDGAGKSTFTRTLARRLRRRGLRVRVRHEPADASLGRYAQQVGPRDPWSSAVFFTLDRYLAHDGLARDLARADVVLSDRSFWSTIAYQGSAVRPGDRRRLYRMQRAATRAPDRVILLDLPADVAVQRVGGRGSSRAPFERQRTLTRVGRAYRHLARSNRWVVLDARRSTADLVAQAILRLRVTRRPVRRRPRRPASAGGSIRNPTS